MFPRNEHRRHYQSFYRKTSGHISSTWMITKYRSVHLHLCSVRFESCVHSSTLQPLIFSSTKTICVNFLASLQTKWPIVFASTFTWCGIHSLWSAMSAQCARSFTDRKIRAVNTFSKPPLRHSKRALKLVLATIESSIMYWATWTASFNSRLTRDMKPKKQAHSFHLSSMRIFFHLLQTYH